MKLLEESPAPGVTCWRAEGRPQELRALLQGPEDSPYEGGDFSLTLTIPDRYPFEPPHVRFITPIYHPNIDSDGRICLDTLKMQPQGSWAPAININTLLLTIRVLLSHPNPEDGLVADITEQYKRDLSAFKSDARKWTQLHAVAKCESISCSSPPYNREGHLINQNKVGIKEGVDTALQTKSGHESSDNESDSEDGNDSYSESDAESIDTKEESNQKAKRRRL